MFDFADFNELNLILSSEYPTFELLVQNIDFYINEYSNVRYHIHECSNKEKIPYIEHIATVYITIKSVQNGLQSKIDTLKCHLRSNAHPKNIINKQRISAIQGKLKKKKFQKTIVDKLIHILYKYIMIVYYKPQILKYVSEPLTIDDKLTSINNTINFIDLRYRNARNNRSVRKYNIDDTIIHRYLRNDIAIIIIHDNHLNWATTPEYNLACEKRSYIIQNAIQNKINKINRPINEPELALNLNELFI